ncbi:hypothetical protein IQ265_23210 [Nodosilinea sp. LEGE 06152]|uniref:hypothetical protein n=1 Tax=Nodosilinea sp. LEGE 06152 TaxID=2777966 RepID=UPI00187E3CAF|nr:hypothetical protein [Nodosilinea sp. LEGE 06152]MBE9159721.1 hypothetical protein [Nodosilinea sp. LEGE 06152]
MALDIFDPFSTVFRNLDSKGDQRDPRAEAEALAVREGLIEDLINGTGYLDTTLDCLAEQGIDPDAWINQVVDNLEWGISSGIEFTSNEHGLLLPRTNHD